MTTAARLALGQHVGRIEQHRPVAGGFHPQVQSFADRANYAAENELQLTYRHFNEGDEAQGYRVCMVGLRYQAGFAVAYFIACAAVLVTSRIGGGVALVWIATGLLVAQLRIVSQAEEHKVFIAAGLGNFLATGALGIGWVYAAPMALINLGEGWLAATILRRAERRKQGNTPDLIGGAFLLSAAAPVATALPASILVSLSVGGNIGLNSANWAVGHVLGYLALGPAFAMFLRGNLTAWLKALFQGGNVPALLSLTLVLATTTFSFWQTTLPLLFLPTLAMVFLTYFGGREGASIGMVILAFVGGSLSLRGHGPIALIWEDATKELHFFQFYLAANCLTLLPVSAAISVRDRLMRSLSESEMRYRLVADNVTDIVLALEPMGTIRFISPSISNYGPYSADELIGRSVLDLVAPEFREIVRDHHRRTLGENGKAAEVEFVGMTHDGERRWFECVQRCLYDERGDPAEIIGTVREISARKALETELSIAAQTDELTGLPNRRAMLEAANLHLAVSGKGAFALLDLDYFKRINDRHGHHIGDVALQHFARVADDCLRGSDMLARWGGEEFALLLPDATSDQASAACQRILDRLENTPIQYGTVVISFTFSAGIALLGNDLDAVLQRADDALYEAKQSGRARMAVAA